MVLSKGIIVSFLLHVTIVTAALAINGRGMVYHAPAGDIFFLLDFQ